MNFGTRSHPTMTSVSIEASLPELFTSNGFCICAASMDQCTRSQDADCGVRDTMNSLHDSKFRKVKHLLATGGVCHTQFDWPYWPGTMRDGTIAKGHGLGEDTNCDISDRLPPFKYRYVSNATISSRSSQTSLDKVFLCIQFANVCFLCLILCENIDPGDTGWNLPHGHCCPRHSIYSV